MFAHLSCRFLNSLQLQNVTVFCSWKGLKSNRLWCIKWEKFLYYLENHRIVRLFCNFVTVRQSSLFRYLARYWIMNYSKLKIFNPFRTRAMVDEEQNMVASIAVFGGKLFLSSQWTTANSKSAGSPLVESEYIWSWYSHCWKYRLIWVI